MQLRILIAPLDWGLGHATRCIPIIRALLLRNASIIIASNGAALALLQQEFPDLTFEKLPAYQIAYRKKSMIWNMALQLPKIIWTIIQEHKALKKLVKKHQIKIVISDNRYGCYNRNVKSIFLTHQINIIIPNFILQSFVRFATLVFIKQFDACWIPDYPEKENLSGILSHPAHTLNATYVGILTRMQYLNLPKKWDIIIVLSGPEPQRSFFEYLIIQQAVELPHKILLVQGKPLSEPMKPYNHDIQNLQIVPFLKTEELNKAMAMAGLVICRSGYSTLMDLAILCKNAILIPTPGQTEQEYLANYLFEKGVFYIQRQAELNLEEAIQKSNSYVGFQAPTLRSSFLLDDAIEQLLY